MVVGRLSPPSQNDTSHCEVIEKIKNKILLLVVPSQLLLLLLLITKN